MQLELNKLESAKEFLGKLANGINPINDEFIPNDDTVNDVRISRCLFYVTDILNQLIDANGNIQNKKTRKKQLSVSDINYNSYKYTEKPIKVSQIAYNINALINDTTKKLKTTSITNWLVEIGMLEIVEKNGKNHKEPTENGTDIGIVTEDKISANGFPYTAVLYSKSAQEFIIDNLEAIVEYNNRKEYEPINAGAPWTTKEDDFVKNSYENGMKVSQIARELKRTRGAIDERLRRMYLK